MSSGTTADVFIPQVATDTIVAGIRNEGMSVLYGSQAVNVDSSLGAQGRLKVGRKIIVPYFGLIPAFQDDVPEDGALSPDKASEVVEEAEVRRSGIMIEWSTWEEMVLKGRSQNLDPYPLFGGQVRDRLKQLFERRLVTAAVTGLSSAYINAAPANASQTIDWDNIADTKQLLGDAASDIAMISVHSKVKTDLVKLKDSMNRPLLLDATAGTNEIPRLQGLPVYVSDYNVVSADVPPKYDSLLLQRGALALWHTMPTIEIQRVGQSDRTAIIVWVYYIAYRYLRLPGGTKPGVLILRTR